MAFCKYCGKELREGMRFCGGCGNAVEVVVPQKQIIYEEEKPMESILDNKITYGTEDKTPGVSNLPEGTIYIRYSAV